MPFIALETEKGMKVVPEQVEKGAPLVCPECEWGMTIVRRSTDGKARHFRHDPEEGGGGGGGGGDGSECTGESDTHRQLKSVATSRLEQVFGDRAEWCGVEHRLESPTGNADYRQSDAIAHFRERDEQLGNGLIIEVQYRNEGKDIEETTEDYLAQGYAVAWVDPDDFNEAKNECLLTETALRRRARSAALTLRDAYWEPYTSLTFVAWRMFQREYCRADESLSGSVSPSDPREYVRTGLKETGGTQSKVPARLPREYYDQEALKLWHSVPWSKVMNVRGRSPLYDQLFQDISGSEKRHVEVPARLPEEYLKQSAIDRWRSTPWESLVSDDRAGYPLAELPSLADIGGAAVPHVPVTLPFEWLERELHAATRHERLLERFDKAGPSPDVVRVPHHPRGITRDRIVEDVVCRESEHRWAACPGYYWRECRECGLADVTVADLGQTVETPYVSDHDRRKFNGRTEKL